MVEQLNILGAVVAVLFFVSASLVFILRLVKRPGAVRWLRYFEYLLALPLIYLLIQAPVVHRATLYYIQAGFVLLWLALEWVLDDLLKLDFRHTRWMVITYVVLFFAAAVGLVGIASQAGQGWINAVGLLFLVTEALTYIQYRVIDQVDGYGTPVIRKTVQK